MPTAPQVRPHVLLIDDDQKLTRLLAEFLRTQGLDVVVAHDGAQGLQSAKDGAFDLIILDIMLPRIDGFQVLKQLRRHSQVPVLMLTGRGAEDDLIAGLEGGADDYLAKTASSRELITRVRALLRRATVTSDTDAAPPTDLQLGPLKIRAATRSVFLDDVEVALTKVEYVLLTALARHPGHVRSREQLAKEIRNRDFEIFDRSIDVHVASLRRKLGDDSRSARFIRTVRSAGYLFIDPSASPS